MKFKKIFSIRTRQLCGTRKSLWLAAFLVAGRDWNLLANPTGMTVVSGSASSQQNGSQLNVTTSQFAVLELEQF